MKKNLPAAAALAVSLLLAGCAGPAGLSAPAPLKHQAHLERITASAWGAADAETGEIVIAKLVDTPHKSASITKVMTGLLVAELAEANPSVLQQRVTFSEAAAARVGSKADVKAGESLILSDMLYALMLPSGNDAGYALAQHFNQRFTPGDTSQDGKGFIAAMNRRAQALGMTSTIYRSSFGDGGTPDDRTTTVRDLLTLARTATAQPLLKKVMSTRTFATWAQTPDGGSRPIGWSNTNRLLAYPNVTGVKTGTTKLAGACLLSEMSIGGKRYYIVVLGSKGSDQRYVDTLMIAQHIEATKVTLRRNVK